MNDINKYSSYGPSFFGINQRSTNVSNHEDETSLLVKKCSRVLGEMAEREVPENNKFKKVFVAFDIPETRNEALFIIEHDALNPKDMRRLSVNVRHLNTDKFFSQFVLKGTKKEILDYLKDEKNCESLLETTKILSERTDKEYK